MSDLPIPRDEREAEAMRAAFVEGWLHVIPAGWYPERDGLRSPERTAVATTVASELIRCRPEFVESPEPAPSGAVYRLYRDHGNLIQMKGGSMIGGGGAKMPFADLDHVLALKRQLEDS